MINNIWRYIFDVRPVREDGDVDIELLKQLKATIDLGKGERSDLDGDGKEEELPAMASAELPKEKISVKSESQAFSREALLRELEDYMREKPGISFAGAPGKTSDKGSQQIGRKISEKDLYLAQEDYFALKKNKQEKKPDKSWSERRPVSKKPEIDYGAIKEEVDRMTNSGEDIFVRLVKEFDNEEKFLPPSAPKTVSKNKVPRFSSAYWKKKGKRNGKRRRFLAVALVFFLGLGLLGFGLLGDNFFSRSLSKFKEIEIEENAPSEASIAGVFGRKAERPFFESDLWKGFAGYSKDGRTYLLVFQNEAELRPAGGLIESYGVLSLKSGRVEEFFVKDIFDADSRLQVKIIPPDPISRVATAWSMHDANWFPDFELSAKKLAFLYKDASGRSVDGVIAVNNEAIRKVLVIMGPVVLKDFGIKLGAHNFWEETQKSGHPLKAKFLEALFSRVLDSGGDEVFNSLLDSLLDRRHIQVYLKNDEEEQELKSLGWAGAIKNQGTADYLGIYHANIDGGETDKFIKEEISHRAQITNDDFAVNTVTIKRTLEEDLPLFMENEINRDYLRVYVPRKAELLSAEGFFNPADEASFDYEAGGFIRDNNVGTGEVKKTEFGKRIFGGWIQTRPGETSEVTLKYVISEINAEEYDFYFQKQSGLKVDFFRSEVISGGETILEKEIKNLEEDFQVGIN